MNLTICLTILFSCWLCLIHNTVSQFEFNLLDEFPSSRLNSPRDPRQNRGPVLFPPSSPGDETSGVRVGASGFGFVPPSRAGKVFAPTGSGGPSYFDDIIFWRRRK